MKTLFKILIIWFLPFGLFGQQIYDNSNDLIGRYNDQLYLNNNTYRISNNIVYKNGSIVLKIQGKYIYSSSNDIIGRVENNRFYSKNGTLIGRIQNNYVYNQSSSIFIRSNNIPKDILIITFFILR